MKQKIKIWIRIWIRIQLIDELSDLFQLLLTVWCLVGECLVGEKIKREGTLCLVGEKESERVLLLTGCLVFASFIRIVA